MLLTVNLLHDERRISDEQVQNQTSDRDATCTIVLLTHPSGHCLLEGLMAVSWLECGVQGRQQLTGRSREQVHAEESLLI
jgi:hypothetical protein